MVYNDEIGDYNNKKLNHCLEKIKELPSFPYITLRAISLLLKEDVDLKVVADVIQGDPGLVVKILQRVNSVEKARVNKITDLSLGISLIGIFDLLCILFNNLSFHLLKDQDESYLTYHREILSHSLSCGIFSYLISGATYPELKPVSFSMGILHDIGKLGIFLCERENYLRVLKLYEKIGDSIKAEQEVLKYNHVQVGGRLSKEWRLSDVLTFGIEYHHLSVRSLVLEEELRPLLCILKLANILSHEFLLEGNILEEESKEKEFLIEELGLDLQEIKDLTKVFVKEYREKSSLFELEGDLEELYLDIVDRARKRVSTLALELSKQKRELDKNYEFQKIINEIGLSIYKCDSVRDIFQKVAFTFLKQSLFKAGLIYILDSENWILEGHIWHRDKKGRDIRCFLDKRGKPIWDKQTSKFPSVLKELFSSYKERIQVGIDSPGCCNISYKPPFYTIPIYSDNLGIHGELCLAPDSLEYRFSESEKLYLFQIVKLVVSCLENTRLIDRLEKKNEELTFALWKNQQLQKKILHTERLAIAGQLAAGAAHEINNPLAVINARAQLLYLKETDEVKKKHLSQIMEQIERISNILTRLMDFARPAPPALMLVNVHELLDKVLEFVSPGLRKHNIIVERAYNSSLPAIKADPNQLEQVFLNLIINSQHAMEEKGGRLYLRTSYDSDAKQIYIEIVDEGCGISEKDLKNIFDPFFTTKAPGKGTGLGLSISNSIIENHYGRLEISSQLGEGTRVKISLPIDINELRELDSFENFSKQQKSFNIKPRVLIVDDEKHIREILSETLEAEAMETMCCSDGAEAIEFLDKYKFNLILLDMKMPILDGLSLINSIKRKGYHIPIIIITGMATHEEISEALSKGAYKCIKKPFHIKSLLKDVKDVLKEEGFFEELPM